ncbi:GPW/gp25 family protein [Frankia sp. CNm7]|uniref:GPW/gp25 family protein n=1 Tax=Frankia nepalensis TaxID=1836974 RepID=A0A937RFM5_9ACTN|nr:GPW/gp25 family protein [Frankia nepalensis]MBL7501519.1 GPW/gp25 family protein [Frankia nepalensis]MBL7514232.1 GPW/gp25 family protein [Frankia nepalensis]MBL7518961.1 GPW/gp25 family protein [Frankia nepalensis]MBL7626529.1 GPW/gp25 family protein [Frankia nepalensis]
MSAGGPGPGPVAYPLRVDGHGATARTDEAGYLRGLVEQVLFTAPGERVNRPDFGAGLGQLLFAPTGPEVAATTQLLVHGALTQWLGDLIEVDEVRVSVDDAALVVEVSYRAQRSQRPATERFTVAGGAP